MKLLIHLRNFNLWCRVFSSIPLLRRLLVLSISVVIFIIIIVVILIYVLLYLTIKLVKTELT
jgi:hypothetical protein